MARMIAVEAESPDDSATLFRLRIDDMVVGQELTAAQAHLLVGEILERVVLPRRNDRFAKLALIDDRSQAM